MEDILSKRISSNPPSKPQSLTIEHEQYTLQLRKSKLESQVLKRRLNTFKTTNGISLQELNLPPELKSQEFINKVISSPSYDDIFKYINEINNSANYNPNLFKYGLYLLKHKLLDDNSTDKAIPALIHSGFFDVLEKIFAYAKTQIDKSPSEDLDDLVYDLYYILINYAYYATEEENEPLVSELYLSYHYFLLKNESNDNIISSIIMLLANIACHSYKFASSILEYENEDLLEVVLQYISSGINHNKYSIISQASDLLYSYINTIEAEEIEETNDSIIEKIMNISMTLLHTSSTFYSSIYTLSIISSLFPALFNNILSHSDVFSAMISFNYSDDVTSNTNSECLLPFFKLIANLFKNNSDNEGEHYNELYSILELNLFDFITKVIHEYKASQKMKEKSLNAIRAICDCDKRFIVYMINNNASLIELLIEMTKDSHYSIKERAIDILHSMTIINSFTITASLVTRGLMKSIIDLITPDLTSCLDCNILLKSLNVIHCILSTGEWIQKINHINSFAVKYEQLGGRDILEKYLGHPNKDVYTSSQAIIDTYYT